MTELEDQERFFALQEDEAKFLKQQTGIQDDQELKKHIIEVQAEAFAVFPYRCIQRFAFTKLKISRFPAYQNLLKLGKDRPGALFLDIGCCFGNDIRKAVLDGFPVTQVIGSDLNPEFWELGHKLFRTTPESFLVPFIPGNAFDPEFLAVVPPFSTPPNTDLPPLSSLKSLNPLHGRLSAIHASALFHLFDESEQATLARALASLISPEPGSIIFGAHGGLAEKGFRSRRRQGFEDTPMFCHSPESWINLWEKEIFKGGEIRVWAILKDMNELGLATDETRIRSLLVWSVVRL